MKEFFLLISAIFPLISPVVYAKAILKGRARPHRTTRFVLFIIAVLATFSLFAQHDRVAIWLAGASAIQGVFLFILSIKYGMGGWAKIDILCLLIALAGILIWQTTQEPIIALYFAILADFTGMIPAIKKTYHFPHTEIWAFFALDIVASVANLLAIASWTPQAAVYPLYIVFINTVMILLIVAPRPKPTTN